MTFLFLQKNKLRNSLEKLYNMIYVGKKHRLGKSPQHAAWHKLSINLSNIVIQAKL